MKNLSRLFVLFASLIVFAAADATKTDAVQPECERDPAAFDACMHGVNTAYDYCMQVLGDPWFCDGQRLNAEVECWTSYCLVIPEI